LAGIFIKACPAAGAVAMRILRLYEDPSISSLHSCRDHAAANIQKGKIPTWILIPDSAAIRFNSHARMTLDGLDHGGKPMKLWQCKAFCSLIVWSSLTSVFAQDGFTVPIGPQSGLKIKAPERGAFHSAFLDSKDTLASSSDLLERARRYEEQSGLKLQLVTFQSNWRNGFEFPSEAVTGLYATGYYALVRIIPGLDSSVDTGKPDPIFDLRKIADGSFDAPLVKMLQSIAALKGNDGERIPLMIAFAPEPNGGRYRHSGSLYGGAETKGWGDPNTADGPEIYRAAYRHLIDLARRSDVGATNITWALHLESEARPQEAWNAMKNYYPGDDYMDWLGLTVLGAHDLQNVSSYPQFQDVLLGESPVQKTRWAEFLAISDRAAKGLFKFAVREDPSQSCRKADWLSRSLDAIPKQFSQFKLVNYWNESRPQDPRESLRLDTSSCAVESYRTAIKAGFFQGRLRRDQDGQVMPPSPPTPPAVGNVPTYAAAYSCDQDVRSFNGPLRLRATFQGAVDFEVHWIDGQGRLTFMGWGRPGRPLLVDTAAGHAFAIRVGGRCAGKVKIGLNNNIFQVGP
jgi:hypothetical protein